MNTPAPPRCSRRRGFTLPEALIVVLVGGALIGIIHTVFSRTVFSTTKGTDNLDTIRAATRVFRDIRKDLLGSKNIEVPTNASATVEISETTWSDFPVDADRVTFHFPDGLVEYFVDTVGTEKRLTRKATIAGNITTTILGAGRVRDFRAQLLWKRQRILPGATFTDGVLRLEVELDSRNERFPTKQVRVQTFLTSRHMTSSVWRHF